MIFCYSPTLRPRIISFVGYLGDLMRVIRAIGFTSHPDFSCSFFQFENVGKCYPHQHTASILSLWEQQWLPGAVRDPIQYLNQLSAALVLQGVRKIVSGSSSKFNPIMFTLIASVKTEYLKVTSPNDLMGGFWFTRLVCL